MSGIEVVGLVLGAVPITLLAVDGYLKLAESVERYRKYRERLSLLYNLLKIEHAIYHNNCKSLLRGIVSDSDAEKLIEDPRDNSDKWREQELELAFKNRLGTDYEPFMGTVIELNKVIGKFDKKLKVGPEASLVNLDVKVSDFLNRSTTRTPKDFSIVSNSVF